MATQGIDSNTKLMLHCNGTDGSTTFIDSSLTPKTVTAIAGGTAQIDTDIIEPFGTYNGILQLDGNSDYLWIADHPDWFYDTYDFTEELRVNFASTTGVLQGLICQVADVNNRITFYLNAAKQLGFFANVAGVIKAHYLMTSAWSYSADTWYQLAVVRNGTSLKIYINGVSQTLTVTNAISTNSIPNIAAIKTIGVQVISPSNNYFYGRVDEVRISPGIARWVSDFTPRTTEYTTDDVDLSETVSLSDDVELDVSLEKSENTETVTLSDETYVNNSITEAPEDNFGMTDEILLTSIEKQQESETLTLSEEIELNVSLEKQQELETISISDAVELTLYETYDLDNDFRTSLVVTSNINSKINTAIASVKDYNNKFRMFIASIFNVNNEFRNKKPVVNNVINNFRMLLPWQRSATLGIQSLGKSYIKVYINGIEQTDVDLDSINISKSYNISHQASFILLRPYDNTVPTLEHAVIIKYNEWILYNGFIVSTIPSDSPDTIRVNCQDLYWKNNRTTSEFNLGHKPIVIDSYATYYEYISSALSSLGISFGIGGFIPDTTSFSSDTSNAITDLVSLCGNYAWCYENGTPQLITLGQGSIIDLDVQQLNENLNLYHVLSWTLESSAENIINQYRVYTGGYNWSRQIFYARSRSGIGSSVGPRFLPFRGDLTTHKSFTKSCIPSWNADLEQPAWESATGYGYDYHTDENSGLYAGVFTDYHFDARDDILTSKGYEYYDELDTNSFQPYLHIRIQGIGTGDSPSINLQELRARKSPMSSLTVENSFGIEESNIVEAGATEGYLYEGFDINIKSYSVEQLPSVIGEWHRPWYGTVTLSKPVYMAINTTTNMPSYKRAEVTAYYACKRRVPEGQDPTLQDGVNGDTGLPDNPEQQLTEGNYIYNFYTAKLGSYSNTILKNLYLSGYSVKEGYWKSLTNNAYSFVQGWNDIPYASDLAAWELSKTQDVKYKGAIKITLDTLCTYGITLSSRIRMLSASSQIFNVTNVNYNFSDFTAELTIETFTPYTRTVSLPYHGE